MNLELWAPIAFPLSKKIFRTLSESEQLHLHQVLLHEDANE